MIRVLAVAFAFLLVLSAGKLEAEELVIPEFVISGGDLPGEIRLPPPDADNFRRRINLPPRLEEAPTVSGPSYRITSEYWDEAVRREEEGEDELDVDPTAIYYPEGGFIRALLGGDEVWMVINLRQRAVLDRNIRLATDGAIGSSPSSLEVIGAALGAGELLAVEAGGRSVPRDLAHRIIAGLVEATPEPFVAPREPVAIGGSIWLVITMPEGRALQYYFDGSHVFEALGTERYNAANVAALLEGLTPETVLTIEQQEPVGGLFWWPITIGGGIALIALAILLRRRYPDLL